MVRPEDIKTCIEQGLACQHLEVVGDGQHFQALIVSPDFVGKSRIQRHQLVFHALEKMDEEVHALSMRTLTPEEWAQ
jgi:acid stress-induced BolA-like protein IbaG/YrbA